MTIKIICCWSHLVHMLSYLVHMVHSGSFGSHAEIDHTCTDKTKHAFCNNIIQKWRSIPKVAIAKEML